MRPPDLSTGQLAALYLEALRQSDHDPEALIAARHLGQALDRRRRGGSGLPLPTAAAPGKRRAALRQPRG